MLDGCSAGPLSEDSAGQDPSLVPTVLKDQEALQRSTEFFGFAPPRFVDDVYNASAIYVRGALDAMEAALIEDTETSRYEREIRLGIARIQQKVLHSLDRNIDKFELYVSRNIFHVPAHIDLTHTSSPTSSTSSDATRYTADDDARLDEELASLRRDIRSAEFVNIAMKNQMANLDQQLEQYASIRAVLAQAAERAAAAGAADGNFPAAASAALALAPEIAAVEKQQNAAAAAAAEALGVSSVMLSSAGGFLPAAAAAAETGGDPLYRRCKAALGGASTADLRGLACRLAD